MNFRSLMIVLAMCFCMTVNYCCVSSDANSISKELKSMEKGISLPYHHVLIDYVRQYEQKTMPELFIRFDTIFEKELQDRGMPLELKYLPLSLTEMKPDYEKDDRCGIWALPTLVGLHYGLTIDESHDERFSIEASTKAALDYLSDLYQKYDDWWYSILAFSNSPNSVQHAISHGDKKLQLWDFYDQKLIPDPNIICNLIACVYVYHDYEPIQTNVEDYASINFTHPINIKLLAQRTGVSIEKIRTLNPVFRSSTLTPLKGYQLVLPKKVEKDFPTFEQKLYDESAEVDTIEIMETPEKPVNEDCTQQDNKQQEKKNEKIVKHKVKKGETLSHIAQKHHVTIDALIDWNHLENDLIRDGQELIIKQ